jgi:hypothetical protein
MTVPRWLGALCAAFAALALVPAAKASCAPLPPLAKPLAAAEVVFVGTVTRLEHDGRVATFRVEEVRKGVVGSTVVVNGSAVSLAALEKAARKGLGIASSVDRTYELGVRYLVVPHDASREVLLDNSCSATQIYMSKLDASGPPREASFPPPPSPPATGRPVEPPEGISRLTLGLVAAAIGVAAAAASAGLWLRRTKRAR